MFILNRLVISLILMRISVFELLLLLGLIGAANAVDQVVGYYLKQKEREKMIRSFEEKHPPSTNL